MRKDFYTEQELMAMPMEYLRGIDVENKDQEALVQKIVNRRMAVLPPSSPINRRDVPDIETPEQERDWQAKIDARVAKMRPLMEIDAPPSDTPPQESPEQQPEPTVQPDAVVESPQMRGLADEGEPGKPVTITSGVPKTLRSNKRK